MGCIEVGVSPCDAIFGTDMNVCGLTWASTWFQHNCAKDTSELFIIKSTIDVQVLSANLDLIYP